MNKGWTLVLACVAFVFVLALSGYARADAPTDREVAVSVDVDVGGHELIVDSQAFYVEEGVWVEVPGYVVLKFDCVEPCGHQGDESTKLNASTRPNVQQTLESILPINWSNNGPKHRWIRA